MTAIPHGERPLWIIVSVALAILVPILATALRPARHERSIYRNRNYRGRHWE